MQQLLQQKGRFLSDLKSNISHLIKTYFKIEENISYTAICSALNCDVVNVSLKLSI